ncbi:MAG: hypothetical protein FWC57_01840, partial [Endomicrobia bacterium]|nr:hypothetical protein [Endomicrobiia bacterium]
RHRNEAFSPDRLYSKTSGGPGAWKTWNIYRNLEVPRDFIGQGGRIDEKTPPILVSMDVETDINPKRQDGMLSTVPYKLGNFPFSETPRYFRVTFTGYTDDLAGNHYESRVVLNMVQTTRGIICLRSRRVLA